MDSKIDELLDCYLWLADNHCPYCKRSGKHDTCPEGHFKVEETPWGGWRCFGYRKAIGEAEV